MHKGWLCKKGHDLRAALGMGGWKNRFFVLYYTKERKEYVLRYYKQQEGNLQSTTESEGTINLAGASVAQAAKSPAGSFQFVVTTADGKKYPVRSETSTERAEWIERIGRAINPINPPLAAMAFSSCEPAPTMGTFKVTALPAAAAAPLSTSIPSWCPLTCQPRHIRKGKGRTRGADDDPGRPPFLSLSPALL